MSLTAQDRADITDLINLHGQLVDAGDLDQAGELFTEEVTYDLCDFGLGVVQGRTALRDIARSGDTNQPVGHHVTNIVITVVDDLTAQVRSKGIGIMADGTAGSVTYDDVVTRRPIGWKITYRKVTAQRRTATSRQRTAPTELFRRYQQAALDQSHDAIADLLAEDAVLEFPFTRPGLPSRLEGRNAIMDWVAQAWGLLRYDSYDTVTIHETNDPETIIVEQSAAGRSATTGAFRLPNIVVLTVSDGKIGQIRDYVNVPAALDAIGAES